MKARSSNIPRSGSKIFFRNMAQIKDILQEEQRNDGLFIRLYAEGIFYKAYERSAWT